MNNIFLIKCRIKFLQNYTFTPNLCKSKPIDIVYIRAKRGGMMNFAGFLTFRGLLRVSEPITPRK